MSNQKSNGFGGKGYYIALVLCAAAIGITGYLYYKNSSRLPEDVTVRNTQPTISAGVTEDVPVLATQPPRATANTPTAPATLPEESGKVGLKTVSPVEGEEVASYSVECLSYNQTTRDWRTHNGVDIAAADGTEVCAAAEGTVTSAYEDDAMGYTVVIRHTGGYTTTYSSLRDDISVKTGDTVEAGQCIGYVGETALLESAIGSHVHFGVTYQDHPMDPGEFLAMS